MSRIQIVIENTVEVLVLISGWVDARNEAKGGRVAGSFTA